MCLSSLSTPPYLFWARQLTSLLGTGIPVHFWDPDNLAQLIEKNRFFQLSK